MAFFYFCIALADLSTLKSLYRALARSIDGKFGHLTRQEISLSRNSFIEGLSIVKIFITTALLRGSFKKPQNTFFRNLVLPICVFVLSSEWVLNLV